MKLYNEREAELSGKALQEGCRLIDELFQIGQN